MPNLDELRSNLAELRRRREQEAIRYFTPHGGQAEFIKLALDPGAFVVISGAGNGWGKSEVLAAIMAAVIWPNLAPSCFALPLVQAWPYPKRARIYSKPAELEEIGSLQTAINKYFPANKYEASKGRYSYPSVFHSNNGWVMDLFSYERDESEAAGPNIGLQMFNEPPPEPLWKEALARARSGGIIIGGMTSLFDNPWIVDGILNKHNGRDIRVRYGNACENCKTHGRNGNLEHSQIEKILSQYDPDERDARFTGKPLSMSGRIFKGFDRSVHVSKEVMEPPKDSGVYMVVDPAIAKPLAVIWAYVDKAGVVRIYDEWPEFNFHQAKDPGYGVKDYAQMFLRRENGRTIQTRILDRHFGNARRSMGGLSLREEFSEVGLDFQDSYTVGEEVETGIAKVKDYLRYDTEKPISALNQPRLLISPNCVNTIAAMERWGRNPKTGKPMDEYKDFCDVVRYLVMANPEYEVPAHWENPNSPYYGVNT